MDTNQHRLDQLTCTLDAVSQAHRRLEWADLAALALSSEHLADGVASTFPLEIGDAVLDLVAREERCCGSWLAATTQQVDGVIRLTITSEQPEGQATIKRVAGSPT